MGTPIKFSPQLGSYYCLMGPDGIKMERKVIQMCVSVCVYTRTLIISLHVERQATC